MYPTAAARVRWQRTVHVRIDHRLHLGAHRRRAAEHLEQHVVRAVVRLDQPLYLANRVLGRREQPLRVIPQVTDRRRVRLRGRLAAHAVVVRVAVGRAHL